MCSVLGTEDKRKPGQTRPVTSRSLLSSGKGRQNQQTMTNLDKCGKRNKLLLVSLDMLSLELGPQEKLREYLFD